MSYPGHNNVPKQLPIIPCPPSMLGEGPMQDLTTNKHDYVAKPSTKRPMIVPPEKMFHNPGPLEDETIQRLSFPKPDLSNFEAVVSCKPNPQYKKPDRMCFSFFFFNLLYYLHMLFQYQWMLKPHKN